MKTLRIEIQVRDYDMWRAAFGKDAGGRAASGMRTYRIFRRVDDANQVVIEGEFDDAEHAEAFLDIMRTRVWNDPEKAPAKLGAPRTEILDLMETHAY